MTRPRTVLRRALMVVAAALSWAAQPTTARAQWSTVYKQFYLPAEHNFVFRERYPGADRLFNAFDYGHAILYETLLTRPAAPAALLDDVIYRRLVHGILNRPPRVPLEESAIEPMYARLAPEAKMMFDWAHILHRQTYDVLADERIPAAAKDAEVARLLRYYRSRSDLAFSSRPKNMSLMQEQWYSLAFRQGWPRFNGLIWGYHWLQMALYEPLVVGRTVEERQAGVAAAVARFRSLLVQPDSALPYQMPMTVPIAPAFAARYPELAIIFDNLHSMHDVVSDILANPKVPRDRKRTEILRAARAYRDDTTDVMTVAGWRRMSEMMGVENMGGPAIGALSAPPSPTIARGAVMRHDADGNHIGGPMPAGRTHDAHTGHAVPQATTPATTPPPASDPHAGHAGHDPGAHPSEVTARHRFEDLPDGGRIVLERADDDSAGIAEVRAHLRAVRDALAKGDLSLSVRRHGTSAVPGRDVIAAAAARGTLRVTFAPSPRGGSVTMQHPDHAVAHAVHAFLAWQRVEHGVP